MGQALLLGIYQITYDKVVTVIRKIRTSKRIYMHYAKHLASFVTYAYASMLPSEAYTPAEKCTQTS